MASPNLYLAGLGAASGDRLVTASPIYLLNAARAWYVHNAGTDAASPAGRNREKPLKTTSQAYTNASAGDFIVYLPSHAETIAAQLTIAKARLTFVSEGTGSSRARFTNAAATIMFYCSVAGSQFRNLYFPAATIAGSNDIYSDAAGMVVKDCYFECGALNTVAALRYNAANNARVDGCTFVATASQPDSGMEVTGAQSDLTVVDCIFDGGSYGFSDYAFNGAAAITGLRGENNSMLNNADVILATGTTGYWQPGSGSGSALLEQTA